MSGRAPVVKMMTQLPVSAAPLLFEMAAEDSDMEEFDSEFDSDSDDDTEQIYREIQEDDLRHAAAMFVLRSVNSYLLREVSRQDRVLAAMADRTKEIKRQTKLREQELSKLRKARRLREKMEHAKNKREEDNVAGFLYEFLKLTGQVVVPTKDVGPDPVEFFGDFWSAMQHTGVTNGGDVDEAAAGQSQSVVGLSAAIA